MTVTDAQFSGLSGDLATLQVDVLDNSRLIIGLPNKNDFNSFQATNGQRFNTIESDVSIVEENVNDLITYITNFKKLYTTSVYTFTGFTGHVADTSIHFTTGQLDHDKLSGYVSNEHIDWTQSGAGTIHVSNYLEADAISIEAAGAVMESDTTTAAMSFVVDEDTMASDSDTKIPTQQSVKAYVDSSTPAFTKTISVEMPTSTEDISFFYTEAAITLSKITAVLVGASTPSLTWTLRHGTDRSAAGSEVVTGGTTTTDTTTGQDITLFNDATIIADSFVWLETTAKSGIVSSIHLTAKYTQD